MKNLIFVLFLALALNSIPAHAKAQSGSVLISSEVSRVLLSDEYAKLATDLRRSAEQRGAVLTLTRVNVSQGPDQQIVTIEVAEANAADFNAPAEVKGEIVAMLSQTPDGKYAIDAVFFKPAAVGPSGASVGN
ncbi:MAG: hypothetical protein EOP05_02685 [Proteobacteria bacterium]|nr:MAG: hypothetical protein EOP05_02685 [Pseudomonadota bacterium]